jgi:hypothetical protein
MEWLPIIGAGAEVSLGSQTDISYLAELASAYGCLRYLRERPRRALSRRPCPATACGRQETVWSWRKNLESGRSFSCGAYVCLRPKADIQQSKLNRRLSALCSHSERLSGVWKRTLVRLFADVRFRLNSQARPSTIARPRHLALDLTPPPLAGKQPRHLSVKRCGPAT